MKKIMYALFTGIAILSLIGCSAQPPANTMKERSNQMQQESPGAPGTQQQSPEVTTPSGGEGTTQNAPGETPTPQQ